MGVFYRRDKEWAVWTRECVLSSEDEWAMVWRCEKDGRYAVSMAELWGDAVDADMSIAEGATSVEECIAMAGDMLEGFEVCEPEFEVADEYGNVPADEGMWDHFAPWTKERVVQVEGRRHDVDILVSRVR